MRRFTWNVLAAALLLAFAGAAHAQTYAQAVVTPAAGIVSSVTRSNNTTTYSANTGWNGDGTSAPVVTFSFPNACHLPNAQVLVASIDIFSSANPTTKLQGIVWFFAGTPGTVIADDSAFNIGASSGNPSTGDFSLLTGNVQGFPFTLANAQPTGSNSGVTLAGTIYQLRCSSATTPLITAMVQVVNAYVPAANEVLSVRLNTLAGN
jgi:hypothetical protein